MIENIIYYSICFFFSIIGLGMTWEGRSKCLAVKIILCAVISAAMILGVFFKPGYFAIFDVRTMWSWVMEAHGIEIRFRGVLVLAVFIGVASYIVLIEHLVISSYKRITNRSKFSS
ncbi:hypothetical protein [Agaribacterium sp. ZY112]|uniref:hypothetical protein n=1 Tax=Agaribacterium sp. ZY112 TaxID=3233574 RepID=UPI0035240DBB